MNQLDGSALLMTACFTKTPDHGVYKLRQTKVPLDELNKPLKQMSPKEQAWAIESMKQDLTRPDGINEDRFNRILWHAMKGTEAPYPAALAGRTAGG